jgi:peptidoglycan/xylan/chitin deacetylase (PgdA/CDA1 family)
MAEPSPGVLTRGVVARSRRRRGFVVFCSVMAVVISLLMTSPPGARGADGATSAATERAGHGSPRGVSGPGSAVATSRPADDTRTPSTGSWRSTLARLLDVGQPIFCGGGTRRLVALTFDDGPGLYTRETIDLLRSRGMTATFFEVGKLLSEPRFAGLPREAARLGAVGDHTWDHVPLAGLSQAELDPEILRARHALAVATGAAIALFRPPLERRDVALDAYLQQHGLLDVLWSIDTQDSMGASANEIYRAVRTDLSPGDIILMHENRGTTQQALPRILDLIERRGYTTVTVPQLLTIDPPSPEQLRWHGCG